MAGIVGFFGLGREGLLRRMIDVIRHRGPHRVDFLNRGEIQLASCSHAGREGSGEMLSGDRKAALSVVWDGAIYNRCDLDEELRSLGHKLPTGSVSEALLQLYERYGYRCLQLLRGMFSIAITDGSILFLARDQYGIKPLYWSHLEEEGVLLFASEIKALLQYSGVSTDLDDDSLSESLVLRMISGPRTLFRQVKKIEAGHFLVARRLSSGRLDVRLERYFMPPPVEPNDSISFEEAKRELKLALDHAVRAQMPSGEVAGIFLSGGLDSGLLAAIMSETTEGSITGFTTVTRLDHPEIEAACCTASNLGLEHDILVPTFSEYVAAIPTWIAAQEAVASLSSLSYLLLCRRAIEQGSRICLHGEGSDSYFGGHSGFFGEPISLQYFKSMLVRLKATGLFLKPGLEEAVNELSEASRVSSRTAIKKIYSYYQNDLAFDLEFIDKTSMATGLEIRVPFLDHRVVDLANRLPLSFKANRELGVGKLILKHLAIEHYGEALKAAIQLPKLGFPRACSDFRNRFERLCRKELSERYRRQHPLGEVSPSLTLLVTYDLFKIIFFENRGSIPTSFDMLDFIRSRGR